MTTGRMPAVELEPGARTSYCRHCAELIRYWPSLFTWKHVRIHDGPNDHEPLPMPEGEARAMDGNR